MIPPPYASDRILISVAWRSGDLGVAATECQSFLNWWVLRWVNIKIILKPAWNIGMWWRGGGSNSRPLHCERSALPAELPPHEAQILTTSSGAVVRNKRPMPGDGLVALRIFPLRDEFGRLVDAAYPCAFLERISLISASPGSAPAAWAAFLVACQASRSALARTACCDHDASVLVVSSSRCPSGS